jgi:tetratricopeptide (TPR) repeat protein
MNASIIRGRKKILFYSISVIIPFIFLALIEVLLRLFSVGDDLSLFKNSSDSRYYEINRQVGERYFNKYSHTTPLSDKFLKQKPTNSYRIFVMGESTVQGFPYDANLAFSRILYRRLQDIFPERFIEVVNLGLTAINSYTLLDLTDEMLEQQPDLVLIYAGHNEYYGALGVASMENGSIPHWLKKLHLKLIHLRIYQLLQRGIGNIFNSANPTAQRDINATLMEKMVGRNLIPYSSAIYKEGIIQFSENMSNMLRKIKDAHIHIIISDLVSNVRDLPPFQSVSFESYSRADSIYAHAQQLEANHFYDEARKEYLRAKDLDVIRFRASEDLNSVISNLTDSLKIFHVSLKSIFEHFSSNSFVGNNLMTDHLHPNIDGYFLMTEGFINAILENRLIDNNCDSLKVLPWTYYRRNWGFTELDSMIADIRIKHLKAGWPFQPDSTVNLFRSSYKPHGIVDSLAYMAVMYGNMNATMGHKKLATYYQSLGDLKRASKEYLSIAYISPLDVSSYYYASDLAFKAKEYESAIRYLHESPYPDTSSYVQYMLATIYYSQNKTNDALSCIERFQRFHSDNSTLPQILRLKYQIQKESGMIKEADQTLADVQNIDPTFTGSTEGKSIVIIIPQSIRLYLDKAEFLRKNGKIEEALAELKEANKIKELAYTNLLIGKLLFLQRNIEAVSYLEKANKEIKNDPSLYFSLCALYLMQHRDHEAKAALNNFIRIQGEHHPASIRLNAMINKESMNKK